MSQKTGFSANSVNNSLPAWISHLTLRTLVPVPLKLGGMTRLIIKA